MQNEPIGGQTAAEIETGTGNPETAVPASADTHVETDGDGSGENGSADGSGETDGSDGESGDGDPENVPAAPPAAPPAATPDAGQVPPADSRPVEDKKAHRHARTTGKGIQ